MTEPTPTHAEEHAPINWVTTPVMTLTPLAALIAVPWYGLTVGYSVAAVVSAVVVLWLCGISITAGYHRLWSHRAYAAHWSVRLFFALFGAMSLQNSILIWGSQHRTHHRFVDDWDKDPYSIKRGFFWAHIGWLLVTEHKSKEDYSNVPDLLADPWIRSLTVARHTVAVPIVPSVQGSPKTSSGKAPGAALTVLGSVGKSVLVAPALKIQLRSMMPMRWPVPLASFHAAFALGRSIPNPTGAALTYAPVSLSRVTVPGNGAARSM